MQVKKVSVVIPNYNYARYLNKRIDSIINQSYPIYELIILDDKSNDNSLDVIEKKINKVRVKYPKLKIQIIKNDNNSGKAISQWKKAFEIANGDYVWIAEADDLSRRDFLKVAMEGFSNEKVVLSYTESALINGSGLVIAPNFRWSRDKERTGHFKDNYIKNGVEEIKEIMAIRCTIPNVSAVVFKNDKKNIKYLDEAIKFYQVGDWYFYIKVLEGGAISYNRKAMNLFRIHKGSVTNKSKTSKKHFEEVLEMHDALVKKYDLGDDVKKMIKAEETRIKSKYGIIV